MLCCFTFQTSGTEENTDYTHFEQSLVGPKTFFKI